MKKSVLWLVCGLAAFIKPGAIDELPRALDKIVQRPSSISSEKKITKTTKLIKKKKQSLLPMSQKWKEVGKPLLDIILSEDNFSKKTIEEAAIQVYFNALNFGTGEKIASFYLFLYSQAVLNNKFDVVEEIKNQLIFGLNTFTGDEEKPLILHVLIDQEDIDGIRKILEQGANPTFEYKELLGTKAYQSPYDYARDKGNKEIIDLLGCWAVAYTLQRPLADDWYSIFSKYGWKVDLCDKNVGLKRDDKNVSIFEWLLSSSSYESIPERLITENSLALSKCNLFAVEQETGAKTVFDAIDKNIPWLIAFFIKVKGVDPFKNTISTIFESDDLNNTDLNAFEYFYKNHTSTFMDFYKKYGDNKQFHEIFPHIKDRLIGIFKDSSEDILKFLSMMNEADKKSLCSKIKNEQTQNIVASKDFSCKKYFKVIEKIKSEEKIELKEPGKKEEPKKIKKTEITEKPKEETVKIEEDIIAKTELTKDDDISSAVKKLQEILKVRKISNQEIIVLETICQKSDKSNWYNLSSLVEPAIEKQDDELLRQLISEYNNKRFVSIDSLLQNFINKYNDKNKKWIESFIKSGEEAKIFSIKELTESKWYTLNQQLKDFIDKLEIDLMTPVDAILMQQKISKEILLKKLSSVTKENAYNLKSSDGEDSFLLVAVLLPAEIFKTFFDKGIDFDVIIDNNTPLLSALRFNKIDIAKMLLTKNMPKTINTGTKEGTPLFIAVNNNEIDLVESMLKQKADPNLKIKDKTALVDCIESLDWVITNSPSSEDQIKKIKQIIKLLLEHGADYGEHKYGEEKKTEWVYLGFKDKQSWFNNLGVDEKKVTGKDKSTKE